jgi:hypothetical protein
MSKSSNLKGDLKFSLTIEKIIGNEHSISVDSPVFIK